MRSNATSPVRRWLASTLIGLLVIGGAFLPFESPGHIRNVAAELPFLVISAVILTFRHRYPIIVQICCVAIFAIAAFTGILTPAYVLPAAFSIYAVALHARRTVTFAAAAATAIALPVLSVIIEPLSMPFPANILSARVIQLAAIICFAAAGGDAVRSRRAYIAAIIERAERAEQTRDSEARRQVVEERLSIARDLHDLVAHQIAVINLHAGVASRGLISRPADAEKSLAIIRDAARTVLTEIGDLLSVLRSDPRPNPHSESIAVESLSPPAGLGQLGSLLSSFRESGLVIAHRSIGAPLLLAPAVDLVANRVILEALTNVHKHSTDQSAELILDYRGGALQIAIKNPADATLTGSRATTGSGHGLRGMRERVESVRGSMRVDTAIPGLFALVIELPRGADTAGPVVEAGAVLKSGFGRLGESQ